MYAAELVRWWEGRKQVESGSEIAGLRSGKQWPGASEWVTLGTWVQEREGQNLGKMQLEIGKFGLLELDKSRAFSRLLCLRRARLVELKCGGARGGSHSLRWCHPLAPAMAFSVQPPASLVPTWEIIQVKSWDEMYAAQDERNVSLS